MINTHEYIVAVPEMRAIAPPSPPVVDDFNAEFDENVQLVKVTVLVWINSPPPYPPRVPATALFELNVHVVTVTMDEETYIPPPEVPEDVAVIYTYA